ncbi:acyl-CoA N-acyltransferase [Chlamydoabsidia padenii]|nr:acyl-CoA N-acyltransferase [Chlamydoabsidia padenii]
MVQDTSSTFFVRQATLDDLDIKQDIHRIVNTAYRSEVPVVVGTVQLQPEGPEEAGIGLLSVDHRYQSRGIGGRLVRAAMEEMKVRGYKKAVLHVLETRAELLLWYKKIGFVETGEKEPFVWPELLKVKSIGFLVLKKSLD